MIKNVISIIDGQYGSCGKGKVIGEIATDHELNILASVTNCMPNAGHTFVYENGKKIVLCNIPIAVVNPKTELFIGPGSVIDMDSFIEEYNQVKDLIGNRKIYVHELVPLVEEKHKKIESKNISSGSTNKGSGAVSAEKIMRNSNLKYFKGYENAIVCSNNEFKEKLYQHLDNPNGFVLLEGSQGALLGLNHSGNYPYTTSRDISTSRMMADSGISPERLYGTLMVIRPFPIRINNISTNGKYIHTGNFGGGRDLTWSEINICAMNGDPAFYNCLFDYGYSYDISEIKLIELLNSVSNLTLRQIFEIRDNNFKIIVLKLIRKILPKFKIMHHGFDIDKITLVQALELERLFYKEKGKRNYESEIISSYMGSHIVDLSEDTSRTHKERKIGEIDINQLKLVVRDNTPYGIYLNFFQHLDLGYKGIIGNFKDFSELQEKRNIGGYLQWLEDETNVDIIALGTGAENGCKINKKTFLRQ